MSSALINELCELEMECTVAEFNKARGVVHAKVQERPGQVPIVAITEIVVISFDPGSKENGNDLVTVQVDGSRTVNVTDIAETLPVPETRVTQYQVPKGYRVKRGSFKPTNKPEMETHTSIKHTNDFHQQLVDLNLLPAKPNLTTIYYDSIRITNLEPDTRIKVSGYNIYAGDRITGYWRYY